MLCRCPYSLKTKMWFSQKKKKKANYNKSEYTQIYAKHKTFKNNYRTQNLEETLIFIWKHCFISSYYMPFFANIIMKF